MESQTLEWKSKWREEFLKSLCGLANAQGGTLEIGRDDTVLLFIMMADCRKTGQLKIC